MTNGLGPEARAFLDEVSGAHDPSPEERVRLERALAATLGAAGIAGAGVSLAPKAAAAVSKGILATLSAKVVVASLVTVGAVGTAVIATTVSREHDAREAAASAAPGPSVSSAASTRTPAASLATPRAAEVAHAEAEVTPVAIAELVARDRAFEAPRYAEAEAMAVVRQSPEAGSRAVARRSESGASSSSVAREVAMLEAAKRSLRAGNAQAALASVDAYLVEFASGTMTLEARMLRLDALCALGLVPAAREEGVRLRGLSRSATVENRIARSCAVDDFRTEGEGAGH